MAVRKRKGDSNVPLQSTQRPKADMVTGGSFLRTQPAWITLAVGSGMCAAINGVFAKLTTTTLTSSFAAQISASLGLTPDNHVVNFVLRGSFFGLNLLFNGIMWGLFTAALAKGDSTTRVSIVNVSANFFVTAMLGWMIFSEKLPLQWWAGAALLACGNVIIGRREEGTKPSETTGVDERRDNVQEGENLFSDNTNDLQADLIELDETAPSSTIHNKEEARGIKSGVDIDAPI